MLSAVIMEGQSSYPGGGANNYPLRGGKMTDWQGGIRVNAFVSGGFLPAKMQGQKITGKIHLADWYATFCAIAGVNPTDERAAKAKLPPIDSMPEYVVIDFRREFHLSLPRHSCKL